MEEPRSTDSRPVAGEPPPQDRSPHALASPLLLEAGEVFRRDLPRLLNERRGQWVAYHGADRIGFAATKPEMYQVCLGRGLDLNEILVDCIEPTDVFVFGPGALWDAVLGPWFDPADPSVSPGIVDADTAFRRDLPQLLKECPGQWVAYHGAERIGFAATKPEMDQVCRDRGLDLAQTLVECIEPAVGAHLWGPEPLDDDLGGQE